MSALLTKRRRSCGRAICREGPEPEDAVIRSVEMIVHPDADNFVGDPAVGPDRPRSTSGLPPKAVVGVSSGQVGYGAMCGRLRVGKKNLHFAAWSEQPCVRPISAVHCDRWPIMPSAEEPSTASIADIQEFGPHQKEKPRDIARGSSLPGYSFDRRQNL
jgi:hypothetical protein